MISSTLRMLLGSYNANVLGPDQDDYEIDKIIELFNREQKKEILIEMDQIISNDEIILSVLNRATGELFLSKRHALKFFKDLYKFIAKKGLEPDISEYIE